MNGSDFLLLIHFLSTSILFAFTSSPLEKGFKIQHLVTTTQPATHDTTEMQIFVKTLTV